MKKAQFVHPNYAATGLDNRTRYILEQSSVLPPDLGTYTTSGFSSDCDRLSAILGSDFADNTVKCCAELTRKEVLSQLDWLLSGDPEVACFFFSGHGVNEYGTVHGSMVCSFNQRISHIALDEAVQRAKFRGTLIVILNMCEADHVPWTTEPPVPAGSVQRDGMKAACSSSPRVDSGHTRVTLMASGPFSKTSGNSRGSTFIATLSELFKDRVVTYESLSGLLESGVSVGASVMCSAGGHPALLLGQFGAAAKPSSVSESSRA